MRVINRYTDFKNHGHTLQRTQPVHVGAECGSGGTVHHSRPIECIFVIADRSGHHSSILYEPGITDLKESEVHY